MFALVCASSASTAPAFGAGALFEPAPQSHLVRPDRGHRCRATDERDDGRRERKRCAQHVLLISIDGMHAVDLRRYVATHPASALATLSRSGVTYADAHAAVPTDSFPGLLALTTGGHPKSTGVYYEDSFDRSLFPPNSNCSGPRGTEVAFDESIDKNANVIDGGGGLNPAALTQRLDGDGFCRRVFPHDYLRVNTVFEVVKSRGGRTAWSDKEQSYEILNGPSGRGVDDLYNREIAAGGTTGSLVKTEAYDDGKVAAILNEIEGRSARGLAGIGTPALFGMNFQAVSVGQKLALDPTSGRTGGYLDALGTPTPLLEDALEHTDASLQKMLVELARRGLADTTLIVISAKHGQQPIDRRLRRGIPPAIFGTTLAKNLGNGFIQTDDLALIWLQNRSQQNVESAFDALQSIASPAGFEHGVVFTGNHMPEGFGPIGDPRAPDFAIEPDPGVIYTGGTKIAEHGGFRDDDTHVALLVAYVGQTRTTITRHIETTQVAPTILEALGINPNRLGAVRNEDTDVLPALNF